MNDTAQGVPVLPARAAMLLAVEVLLADPGALGNDALEGDLYILRDQLRDYTDTVDGELIPGRS
jgi:hypothetical protein